MSLTVRFHFPVIKKAETFYFGETKDEFRRDFGSGESFPDSPIPPPLHCFQNKSKYGQGGNV